MVDAAMRPLIGRKYALGHDAIDGDHMAIADGWFRAVNCEQIQFPFLIARMTKLMKVHFDHESTLMHLAGGTLCECHRQEHQMLLDLCDKVAALSGKNWRRAQSLMHNKFPKLIRNHIAYMDQIVVLFINTNNKVVQTNSPISKVTPIGNRNDCDVLLFNSSMHRKN